MTLPPLVIASEDGEVLFYSGNVRLRDAIDAAIRAACARPARGLIRIGDTRAYVKPIILCGKTYLFFMDFDRFCECYGVSAADRAAEGLFDVSSFSKSGAVVRSLRALTQMFADCYTDTLAAEGATFEVRGLARDVAVCLPPNAYALCLALMIRLAAQGGSHVRLSFIRSCGCVRVFADCVGGKPLPAKEEAALRVLLAEVSAVAGFSVEETPQGNALALEPLDISLIGFKADLDTRYRNNFQTLIDLFR